MKRYAAPAEWLAALKANGHVAVMTGTDEFREVSTIDMQAFDEDIHSGPACATCSMTWCEHCLQPKDVRRCDSPVIEGVAEPVPPAIEDQTVSNPDPRPPPFFLVWSPQGERPPSATHETREAAQREAERLAQIHEGQEFYVLAALSKSRRLLVATTHLVDHKLFTEDLPF